MKQDAHVFLASAKQIGLDNKNTKLPNLQEKENLISTTAAPNAKMPLHFVHEPSSAKATATQCLQKI